MHAVPCTLSLYFGPHLRTGEGGSGCGLSQSVAATRLSLPTVSSASGLTTVVDGNTYAVHRRCLLAAGAADAAARRCRDHL